MKSQLRKISIEKRKHLPVELYSEKLIKNLFSMEEYKNSKNILCYYPLKYEVQTLNCFLDLSKNWFLPRVSKDDLEVCPYCSTDLKSGAFNIKEPTGEEVKSVEILDMVIIPAVAADKRGYRIGYGKGYYDRFLSKLSHSCIKVILVYSELLYDSVYPESHDIKSDIIVTDKEILRNLC